MEIREARLSDSLRLAEILVGGWRWAYRGILTDAQLSALDLPERSKRLESRIAEGNLVLVAADEDDNVLGFASEMFPPSLPNFDREIAALYVDPDRARSGIGRSLVCAMCARFRESGDRSLCIHTLEANSNARAFYERLAGTVVGEDFWESHPAIWYGWDDMSVIINRSS